MYVKKVAMILMTLMICISFSGCGADKSFSDYMAGDVIKNDLTSDKCIKLSDNYCLAEIDGRSELFLLEDRILSIPIGKLEREESLPWESPYKGLINGRFSRMFYNAESVMFEYYGISGQKKYVVYTFDDMKRQYVDDLKYIGITVSNDEWIHLNNDSFEEYRYQIYCTGNREDLNKLLSRLRELCDMDKEWRGYVIESNSEYWLRSEGCYQWTMDALSVSETVNPDNHAVSLQKLVEMSKDLCVDIQIIGYCDMLEIRERARIINGVILNLERVYFAKTFDFDIFAFE